MPKFRVTDALGRNETVEASGWDTIIGAVSRTGKRNVFGIEGPHGKTKFYLDRGGPTLWPISIQAASVELSMGGFA